MPSPCHSTYEAYYYAIRSRQLCFLIPFRYLLKHGVDFYRPSVVRACEQIIIPEDSDVPPSRAARGPQQHSLWTEKAVELERLKMFHSLGCPLTPLLFLQAPILQYLHEEDCAKHAEAREHAANEGALDCLAFLHEHGHQWDEDACWAPGLSAVCTVLYCTRTRTRLSLVYDLKSYLESTDTAVPSQLAHHAAAQTPVGSRDDKGKLLGSTCLKFGDKNESYLMF